MYLNLREYKIVGKDFKNNSFKMQQLESGISESIGILKYENWGENFEGFAVYRKVLSGSSWGSYNALYNGSRLVVL